MSDEQPDPILEACLDELLGSTQPPDLSGRILASWEMTRQAAAAPQQHAAPQIVPREPPPKRRQNRRSTWHSVALAVGALTATSAIGLLVLSLTFRQNPDQPPATAFHPTPQPGVQDVPANNEPLDDSLADDEQNLDPPPALEDVPFDGDIEVPLGPLSSVADVEQLAEREILTSINASLGAAWATHKVVPTAPIGDKDWCQRVYERVLGRAPSADEIQQFLQIPQVDRRGLLLTRLLGNAESRKEFADHWSVLWTNSLLARGDRNQYRDGLEQYLHEALRDGHTFDRIVSRLTTANGSVRPEAENYDAAANFLLAVNDKKALKATWRIARVFLDQRLACAMCHDHPREQALTQRRFWELNAFLRQMAMKRTGTFFELVDVDFMGDGRGNGREAAVFFETPNDEVKAAYPNLAGGTNIRRSGLVNQVNRRQLLAQSLVSSADFSRAIVNQCWEDMFGFRLTPFAERGAALDPSEQFALLEQLGKQFAAHGYEFDTLVRWLVLSEPFGLASATSQATTIDMPELGRRPLFSRYYKPQDWPTRTAYKSLADNFKSRAAAADLSTTARLRPDARRANPGLIARAAASQDPDPAYQRGLHQGPDQLVEQILQSDMEHKVKVEHLFRLLLDRDPQQRELTLIKRFGKGRTRQSLLNDIWWSLVNNKESIR